MNKKILITYYSRTGNTRGIAEIIQNKVGGDLFQVETIEKYPEDYHEATEFAKKQIEKGIKVGIENNKNVSNYDIIFIGTPAWWGKMAPALNTFIEENDFSGKTVVPFITHGGGGKYSIDKDIENLTKTNTLKAFSVYGVNEEWIGSIDKNYSQSVVENVDKWLDMLEL